MARATKMKNFARNINGCETRTAVAALKLTRVTAKQNKSYGNKTLCKWLHLFSCVSHGMPFFVPVEKMIT